MIQVEMKVIDNSKALATIPWTQFWDMHSHGYKKEKQEKIYIQAPQEQAEIIFYNRFGHNPHRVSCTCCGADYSISEEDDLAQLTGFHRGCRYDNDVDAYVEEWCGEDWRPYLTMAQYAARGDVLIIPYTEIGPDEAEGELPTQGYVWVG